MNQNESNLRRTSDASEGACSASASVPESPAQEPPKRLDLFASIAEKDDDNGMYYTPFGKYVRLCDHQHTMKALAEAEEAHRNIVSLFGGNPETIKTGNAYAFCGGVKDVLNYQKKELSAAQERIRQLEQKLSCARDWIVSNTTTPVHELLEYLDAAPTEPAATRDWPDAQSHNGRCKYCSETFKGEKERVQSRCCYACSQPAAEPSSEVCVALLNWEGCNCSTCLKARSAATPLPAAEPGQVSPESFGGEDFPSLPVNRTELDTLREQRDLDAVDLMNLRAGLQTELAKRAEKDAALSASRATVAALTAAVEQGQRANAEKLGIINAYQSEVAALTKERDALRDNLGQECQQREQMQAFIDKLQNEGADSCAETVQNTTDEEWLDAIAQRWNKLTGEPWETRDGESRNEGLRANIGALFNHFEDESAALRKENEALKADWAKAMEFIRDYFIRGVLRYTTPDGEPQTYRDRVKELLDTDAELRAKLEGKS